MPAYFGLIHQFTLYFDSKFQIQRARIGEVFLSELTTNRINIGSMFIK